MTVKYETISFLKPVASDVTLIQSMIDSENSKPNPDSSFLDALGRDMAIAKSL